MINIDECKIGDGVFNVHTRTHYYIAAITDARVYLINVIDWDGFWIRDVPKKSMDWDHEMFSNLYEKAPGSNGLKYHTTANCDFE
jgi:hypothetical protein